MRAQSSAIQIVGVVVVVVLVVVTVVMFFFSGISREGSVLSTTSEKTTQGLNARLDQSLCSLGSVCGDGVCCPGEDCPSDCG